MKNIRYVLEVKCKNKDVKKIKEDMEMIMTHDIESLEEEGAGVKGVILEYLKIV
jgi:hypothetical protein